MTDIISKYQDYFTIDWVATGAAIEDRLQARAGSSANPFAVTVDKIMRGLPCVRRYLDGEEPIPTEALSLLSESLGVTINDLLVTKGKPSAEETEEMFEELRRLSLASDTHSGK